MIALLFFFRHELFKARQDPGIPFQTYEKPVAPDYTVPSSWLAIPDLAADVYDAQSPGDVFVVVPGVYRGGTHWVLPVDVDRRPQLRGPLWSCGAALCALLPPCRHV